MVEVALWKGANSYCVAMHCRIQRMLAPPCRRCRPTMNAYGLGLTIDPLLRHTHTHTHTANKGLTWGRRAAIALSITT